MLCHCGVRVLSPKNQLQYISALYLGGGVSRHQRVLTYEGLWWENIKLPYQNPVSFQVILAAIVVFQPTLKLVGHGWMEGSINYKDINRTYFLCRLHTIFDTVNYLSCTCRMQGYLPARANDQNFVEYNRLFVVRSSSIIQLYQDLLIFIQHSFNMYWTIHKGGQNKSKSNTQEMWNQCWTHVEWTLNERWTNDKRKRWRNDERNFMSF